jgi:IS30 family transposase
VDIFCGLDYDAISAGCATSLSLLRQYFPKGSDPRTFTLADLQAVEQRINGRPRKRLAWRSPARVMEAELAG